MLRMFGARREMNEERKNDSVVASEGSEEWSHWQMCKAGQAFTARATPKAPCPAHKGANARLRGVSQYHQPIWWGGGMQRRCKNSFWLMTRVFLEKWQVIRNKSFHKVCIHLCCISLVGLLRSWLRRMAYRVPDLAFHDCPDSLALFSVHCPWNTCVGVTGLVCDFVPFVVFHV